MRLPTGATGVKRRESRCFIWLQLWTTIAPTRRSLQLPAFSSAQLHLPSQPYHHGPIGCSRVRGCISTASLRPSTVTNAIFIPIPIPILIPVAIPSPRMNPPTVTRPNFQLQLHLHKPFITTTVTTTTTATVPSNAPITSLYHNPTMDHDIQPCSLASLPSEILLQISTYLPLSSLNALAQLNHSTTHLLKPSLYKLDARQSSQALCWAAIHNNLETAQSSLSAGANPTTVSDQHPLIKGCSPLMLAAYHGSLPVLTLLLTHPETNPNSRDRKYIRPPITWAIKHRHASIVRALLKDDRTDPNLQDKFGDTALMTAVTLRPDMIPVLLSGSRVDPRVSNTQGATALSRASQRGIEVDLILASHLRFILDGDESAAHCQHVFFYAAISGQLEIVEYLVTYFGDRLDPNGASAGNGNGHVNGVNGNGNGAVNGNGNGNANANANSTGGYHGRGAFSIAVERGHRSVVEYLLRWTKTDPNLSDSWKHQSPLLVAVMAGDEEMVSTLKECERVDLLNPDVSGTTPLHAAVERSYISIVKLLLHQSQSPDQGQDQSQDQVQSQAQTCHDQVSRVGSGALRIADVNARDSSGQTPLHLAVLQDDVELVGILLDAGADPRITCAEGLTALDQGIQWSRNGRATMVLREYMRKL